MTQLCCLIHSSETTFETSGEREACHPTLSPLLRAKRYHLQTPVTQTAFHHFAIKQQQSVRCWCPSLRPAREDYSSCFRKAHLLHCTSPRSYCSTSEVLQGAEGCVALSLKLCHSLLSVCAGDVQQTSSSCAANNCING